MIYNLSFMDNENGLLYSVKIVYNKLKSLFKGFLDLQGTSIVATIQEHKELNRHGKNFKASSTFLLSFTRLRMNA